MATNQTQNIRTIFQPAANIAALTPTQILQLIQSETTAGAQADVTGLQIGDMVSIMPGDVAANTIDNDHDNLGGVLGRLFVVLDASGVAPSVPAARHVLAEISTQQIFW